MIFFNIHFPISIIIAFWIDHKIFVRYPSQGIDRARVWWGLRSNTIKSGIILHSS